MDTENAGLENKLESDELRLKQTQTSGEQMQTVKNIVEDIDDELFRRVMYNENHVLHSLLPDRNDHCYQLRRRRHNRILTSSDDIRNCVYTQTHKYSY